MGNSTLVNYTLISPNSSNPRNHIIDTISIHCVVGQWTAKRIGEEFANSSKQASSNYGVGKNGDIGLYVEEKNRSWCTSSASNDNRAITIEVASDTTYPYKVTDKAYNALLDLLTDICERNNIKELKWQGDKNLIGQINKQNMTVHRWFANKSCPGDYLYNLHGEIAKEVNNRLQKENVIMAAVSDWAKEAHEWVVDKKISDGTRPDEEITREEVWTMLHRNTTKLIDALNKVGIKIDMDDLEG